MQHAVHPRRQRKRGSGQARPNDLTFAGLRSQARPQRLHEKQRVAFRFPIQPGQLLRRQAALGHVNGQRCGFFDAQRCQWDFGELVVAPERGEQGFERRVVGSLFGAHCAQDQKLRPRLEAQQVMQPFERVAVAPLQIVDHQQERVRTPGRLLAPENGSRQCLE